MMNKPVIGNGIPGAAVAAWIDLRMITVLGCLASAAVMTYAAAPDWWGSRSLTKPDVAANDYAVANQGQLKNMVRAACDELLAKGYIDTSHGIYLQVQSWRTNTANAQDYAPVNLGQLKAMAKPIYDVLKLQDPSINYPWSAPSTDDKDYAVANIGQLKNVFSFAIPDGDTNHNGIPDTWEMQKFGSLTHGANDDDDGDGLSNIDEWRAGTNPNNPDSDGDGISDKQEIDEGTDPLDAASNTTRLLGLRVFTELEKL